MSHPERQGWSDDRIVLSIEGDDYTAWCGPDADGGVFLEGNRISVDTGNSGYSYGTSLPRHGSPFPFDIVYHERYPQEGEVEPLAEELGERFSDRFDQKVNEVYETISQSDEPLDTIMDL